MCLDLRDEHYRASTVPRGPPPADKMATNIRVIYASRDRHGEESERKRLPAFVAPRRRAGHEELCIANRPDGCRLSFAPFPNLANGVKLASTQLGTGLKRSRGNWPHPPRLRARRSGAGRPAAAAAPVGGVAKSTKQGNKQSKPAPTAPAAAFGGETKIMVSNLVCSHRQSTKDHR